MLERTIPGLFFARLLHIHEPSSKEALTVVERVRSYFSQAGVDFRDEYAALVKALGFDGPMEADLRHDIHTWIQDFFSNLKAPPPRARFPSDLSPTEGPMRSLRDVEEQAPIFGVRR